MSFCAKCGTQMQDKAQFCVACGTPVGGNPAEGEAAAALRAEGVQARQAAIPPVADAAPEFVGLGPRFVAHLLDCLLVFIMFYVIGMMVAENAGGVTDEGFSLEGTPALVAMGLTFAASLLYFVLSERGGGQTLGKKVMGIKVVSQDGSDCSLRQAFTRNFLRLIDGLVLYLVGIILLVRSDRKQRLGDRIAGTVVVKKNKLRSSSSFVYRTGDSQEADEDENGKVKLRSSWGIKKGRDVWDV